MLVFVVTNPKKGQTWVFDNHAAALKCLQEQRLTQDFLCGCSVSCDWQDGQPVREADINLSKVALTDAQLTAIAAKLPAGLKSK